MAHLTGLAHIGVCVSNMDRSVGFYQDTLGLALEKRFTMDNGTELAFLRVGGCTLELICRPNGSVPAAPGQVDHICFDVCEIAPLVERLLREGMEAAIRERTGLVPDAYFSGTKMQWILQEIPGVRARAERGELCAGTVDSFLVYHLTNERAHVTIKFEAY